MEVDIKISFVIVIYEGSLDCYFNCIKSIKDLAQQHSSDTYEIIVVDNRYDISKPLMPIKNVTYIPNSDPEKCLLLAKATGFEYATGDLVWQVDDDDYVVNWPSMQPEDNAVYFIDALHGERKIIMKGPEREALWFIIFSASAAKEFARLLRKYVTIHLPVLFEDIFGRIFLPKFKVYYDSKVYVYVDKARSSSGTTWSKNIITGVSNYNIVSNTIIEQEPDLKDAAHKYLGHLKSGLIWYINNCKNKYELVSYLTDKDLDFIENYTGLNLSIYK